MKQDVHDVVNGFHIFPERKKHHRILNSEFSCFLLQFFLQFSVPQQEEPEFRNLLQCERCDVQIIVLGFLRYEPSSVQHCD